MIGLARAVPEGWCVVGAQTVVVHELLAGRPSSRATTDIDIVAAVAGANPPVAHRIIAYLELHGFECSRATPTARAWTDGASRIDVMVADHARGPVTPEDDPREMVPCLGGRAALNDAVRVTIRTSSAEGVVPVASLSAALRMKIRAAGVARDPSRHLSDIAAILVIVENPIAVREALSHEDRRLLARLDERIPWFALAEGAALQARSASQFITAIGEGTG